MSIVDRITQNSNSSRTRFRRGSNPLRWRRADALLALVQMRSPTPRCLTPLRLDAAGWRWLRSMGLTRAEAQRALDDLLDAEAITVEEECGVLVVRLAGQEGSV